MNWLSLSLRLSALENSQIRLSRTLLHALFLLGSVFTNKPIKAIANGNLIHLLVEAKDGGDPALSSVTSIDVQMLDTNDHAPTFPQEVYLLTIPEDTPTDTTLLTLSVEDQDWSPENTHLDYVIIQGNEEGRICLDVRLVQIENQWRNIGQLVLCNPLDRETTESYELTVRVSDRGNPPLSSSAIVMVTVADCNDNAPVFSSVEYHTQVSESSPVGTQLVQVAAQDPDFGTNGLLRFDIFAGNDKGHYKLDPESGLLLVNQSLDYEQDSKYILTVRASDGGESSEKRKVAFTVVFITVLDVNDNSPHFLFSTVNCSVPENLPAFTHACSVLALDNDLGLYGHVSYSILSSCFLDYDGGSPEKKEAFAIDPLTGEIHTRQTFDYERESEYCLVVEARDKGGKSTTVRVQVSVKGVDEFSPIFTQKQYHFLLPENSKPGDVVGFVMAMDHDRGVDGMVEYSLVNSSPFFSVNRTIGSIFVSEPVYRRRGSHGEDLVKLVVSAGSPRLSSRTTDCVVFINISSSAEALIGAPLDAHMLSLTISLIVILVVLLVFVGLVLRYKIKEAALKKAASIAANLNPGTDSFNSSNSQNQSIITLQEIKRPTIVVPKRDLSHPYSQSDSSGRGSAEGETAEDQEIKWINEYPRRRGAESVQGKQVPEISHSALPEDDISSLSVSAAPERVAKKRLSSQMASTESLYHFKEEGGGEGLLPLLPATVRMKDLEESMMTNGYAAASGGSAPTDTLSSLVCLDEQLQGSYSWDYILDWEPRFQAMASVFTDIGMLPDRELQVGREDSAAEASALMHPPPLITGVAQPGIRTVPPRRPGVVPTLSRRRSSRKYVYSPLARNTGLTPSAMTPSFSPSLSSLTVRTPNASPMVSDIGVGGIRLDSGPCTASLLEAEIQV